VREVEPGAGRRADAIAALVPRDAPARPRAVAVLDGILAGRAWTDDPGAPTWAVVIETADGTTYCGGAVTAAILAAVLPRVETASGDLIVGFSGPDDPVRRLVPSDPSYVGEAVDFTERAPVAPADLAAPRADGLRLASIDEAILPRTEWADDTILAFGSVANWTERGLGWCYLDGDRVVAQAAAGPRCRGELEMGVWSHPEFRGRGLATDVSARTAAEAESRGDRVWWNAAASNAASLAIARRIGFRRERRYELVAYRTDRWRTGGPPGRSP
jgi:GNAT superfamily N-acetyltransferase